MNLTLSLSPSLSLSLPLYLPPSLSPSLPPFPPFPPSLPSPPSLSIPWFCSKHPMNMCFVSVYISIHVQCSLVRPVKGGREGGGEAMQDIHVICPTITIIYIIILHRICMYICIYRHISPTGYMSTLPD